MSQHLTAKDTDCFRNEEPKAKASTKCNAVVWFALFLPKFPGKGESRIYRNPKKSWENHFSGKSRANPSNIN